MEYSNIRRAKFINRPNRFIANIEIDGTVNMCHVKNTGRCRELLIEGCDVFVQETLNNIKRKTKYDLITVLKGDKFVNIDSQAPNKIFIEWVKKGNLFTNIKTIRPETKYKNSRFDFFIETEDEKIFVEVKGVTLENNGIAKFPDAPTERGVKHITELIECSNDFYKPYIVFIIQMDGILYFTPNFEMDAKFSETLKKAKNNNVNILALSCNVTESTIEATNFIDIKI